MTPSTVATLLAEGTAALADAGIDEARGEARLLLGHAAGISAAALFGYPERLVEDEAVFRFRDLIARRALRTPVAHLTGTREFWSLPFMVTPATLVPRPDTETVVELALDLFADRPPPAAILDLGTGTGCILLALLSEYPSALGIGVDVSADALEVARANADALGLAERCTFVEADFDGAPYGPFALIVSNPPYVPAADIEALEPDVRAHDPMLALLGGADGLDAYRRIVVGLGARLVDAGVAVLEVGIGQSDDVRALGISAGLADAGGRRDVGGIERAVSFYKKGVGKAGGGR